jgi:hypothetical protein
MIDLYRSDATIGNPTRLRLAARYSSSVRYVTRAGSGASMAALILALTVVAVAASIRSTAKRAPSGTGVSPDSHLAMLSDGTSSRAASASRDKPRK